MLFLADCHEVSQVTQFQSDTCRDRDEPIKWLVAAVVPGVKRQLLKKLDADEESLFKLLHRWRKQVSGRRHDVRLRVPS
jgi:hypothetical protein